VDGVRRLFGGRSRGAEAAATRVLETLGSLKGAAMKAGQTLSLFADGLPPEARAIVARLYSRAPKLPYEQIAEVIKAELGAEPAELFASFDPEPIAAASLGQVHAAGLRSGESVAVKVQYPGVADALEDDLLNLASVFKTVGLAGAILDTDEYFAELRTEISGELDYVRELGFLEQFRGFLAPWPDLVVPGAFPALSTRRVLVMERLEGPTLAELAERADVSSEERNHRGEQLTRAVLGPWFRHRVIHADTHPGNYVALADGRLGVLDFGSVKLSSEPFWGAVTGLLSGTLEGGSPDILDAARRAGFRWTIRDQRARLVLGDHFKAVAGPMLGPYEFGADRTFQVLTELKLRYPMDLLRIRAPAEAILIARAVAGLLQDLKSLGAKLDLRPFLSSELRAARQR
jgi:predicted unusual protein kinase regulating ubiquinone biosynthesis (AarF/ABC1/UbiB family)